MKRPTLKEIKRSIRNARKEMGMTQGQMASKLGISQPAYSYYESGDKPIPVKNLRKIAEILDLPYDMLANPQEPEDPSIVIGEYLKRIADSLEIIAENTKK